MSEDSEEILATATALHDRILGAQLHARSSERREALARIDAPALLFKSEAIVHPDEVVAYISPTECQVSYNPLQMALLWNTLATRDVGMLQKALAERHHIALQAARAQARASDRERRLYLKRFYDLDWNDPLLYDLVINTAHLSDEAACELICLAVQQHISHSE